MSSKMNNDFPRMYIPPEVRRKMIEIARQFRKMSTKGERILKNLSKGLELIRERIRIINRTNQRDIPSPFMGEGKGAD
jgi:hypothetical protein